MIITSACSAKTVCPAYLTCAAPYWQLDCQRLYHRAAEQCLAFQQPARSCAVGTPLCALCNLLKRVKARVSSGVERRNNILQP